MVDEEGKGPRSRNPPLIFHPTDSTAPMRSPVLPTSTQCPNTLAEEGRLLLDRFHRSMR